MWYWDKNKVMDKKSWCQCKSLFCCPWHFFCLEYHLRLHSKLNLIKITQATKCLSYFEVPTSYSVDCQWCLCRSIPFSCSKKGVDGPKTKKGMDRQRRHWRSTLYILATLRFSLLVKVSYKGWSQDKWQCMIWYFFSSQYNPLLNTNFSLNYKLWILDLKIEVVF